MAKYIKKPIEVEAFKWMKGRNEVFPEWMKDAIKYGTVVIPNIPYCINKYGYEVMEINTPEGVMIANQGDYIIKGIQGEIYPCKANIFEQTYDRVEEGKFNIKQIHPYHIIHYIKQSESEFGLQPKDLESMSQEEIDSYIDWLNELHDK